MTTYSIRRFAVLATVFAGALLTQVAHADATNWKNDFSHTPGVGGGGFNFNNGPVIGNWDNFSDFGDLILKATFENTSFDNTAFVSGDTIQPWGTGGSTATYGQTFIAPEDSGKLLDFTFYITDSGGGANILYQAFVMTWNGALTGGSSRDESGSTIVYASNPLSYIGDGTFQTITSSIGGGGLELQAGHAYLFGLTTLGADVVIPTGPGITPHGVPDAGSSAVLLLLGLGALGAIRRRNSRA